MTEPSVPPSDRFSRRLQAALALKDFAVSHNLSVDPKIPKILNELSFEKDAPLNAGRMNRLDEVITSLTAVTYPTVIDTVGVSPDPDVIRSFGIYRRWLAGFALVLTLVGVITYYQCRVLAVSGDLTTRSAELDVLTKTLDEARTAVQERHITLTKETNQLKDMSQGSPGVGAVSDASDSVVEDKLKQAKVLVLDATVELEDATERETLAKTKLAEAEREVALGDLWPAVFAVTLGALGASVYLLYAIIGAYNDSRMTMTSLYSEMLRLPIGAIVGWIVYVAFCQEYFRQSFLSQSGTTTSGSEVTSEAFLLLPFLAGYSSKLVVEILNRLIDSVRTTMGIKSDTAHSTASSAATPEKKP